MAAIKKLKQKSRKKSQRVKTRVVYRTKSDPKSKRDLSPVLKERIDAIDKNLQSIAAVKNRLQSAVSRLGGSIDESKPLGTPDPITHVQSLYNLGDSTNELLKEITQAVEQLESLV